MSTYSIGELARLSGVPVKTIRFYSDAGLLPEAARSSGGYRLYGEAERARLELVRALRELGFDLATIRRLLRHQVTLRDVLRMRLRAVEAQLRSLGLARAVLRAALERHQPAEADLRRLHALTRLAAVDREELLDEFVAAVAGDTPARADWLGRLREHLLPELPSDPSGEQLDAWLELRELLADPDYRGRLRATSVDFWEKTDDTTRERTQAALQGITRLVMAALEQGIAPEAPEAAQIVAEHARRQAVARGRRDDSAFRAELVRDFDEHDPRASHHWKLIATVNGWEWPTPQQRAYDWLAAAVRHHCAASPPEAQV